jgi:DNA-directed RNA polymerase specialized sigma24 family protein
VVQGYRSGGYSRERGRLRSWILTILRNRATDLRRRGGNVRVEHAETFGDIADEEQLEALWEAEYRRKLLTDGLEELRGSKNVRAGEVELFVAHALNGGSAQAVAGENDVSLWAVYRATKKCSELLRKYVEQLQESYET